MKNFGCQRESKFWLLYLNDDLTIRPRETFWRDDTRGAALNCGVEKLFVIDKREVAFGCAFKTGNATNYNVAIAYHVAAYMRGNFFDGARIVIHLSNQEIIRQGERSYYNAMTEDRESAC